MIQRGLSFDPGTHTYRLDGRVVPGVTSILAPINGLAKVPRELLRVRAAFGRAVHMASELDDEGILDEDALDPALRPYLAAWRLFKAEHRPEWEMIEQPMAHVTHRYAGTPDRVGIVGGLRGVLDIKSTFMLYPTVGPQLAAYAQMIDPSLHRWGLQLKEDATYTLKPYTNPQDWPMFASLLTVRRWCADHATDFHPTTPEVPHE